ncbi:Uncharacterised protein [Mycobacteroides abscessus subsp. abscessus]|nr:Uncharacterised protein [Mycobacteroides abscessus subsp. abscessus]
MVMVVAFAAVMSVVLVAIAGGTILCWNPASVGTLSTWVSGSATFAAAAVALYQAHRARVDADLASSNAELIGAQASWDSERQRRIEVELQRRSVGMTKCNEILDEIIDVACKFTDNVRIAAMDFENSTSRRDLALTTNLLWVKTRPRIGVRTLAIADSSFAHTLADKTIPSFDTLFDQTSIISEAKSPTALVDFLPEIDAALEPSAEELRLSALEDFRLDLNLIARKIETQMCERPDNLSNCST